MREVRRWLRDQLNARGPRHHNPDLSRRWRGDPIAAALEISELLAAVTAKGQLDARDGQAWADVAGLDGRRHPKSDVAEALKLSLRGLDLRLQHVDRVLERHLGSSPAQRPDTALRPSPDQLLFLSAITRMHGHFDEADGIYSAAADAEGVPTTVRRKPQGRDRTRRLRARSTAQTTATRRVRHLRLDVVPSIATEGLVAMPYTLYSDPYMAVEELRRAWKAGDVTSYPLLLSNACRLVPDLRTAGPALRLDLLEIGCNLLRDSESLLAIGWCRAWMQEARRAQGPRDIRIVKARRTLAHVLQLHGFLSSAATQLDRAIRELPKANVPASDASDELCDLLLRRSSVEVARTESANLRYASLCVEQGLERAFPALRPGLLRNRLQLASLYESRVRRRRSPGITRGSAGYEQALAASHRALGERHRLCPIQHLGHSDRFRRSSGGSGHSSLRH
jgi:hypothetical protein